MGNTNVKTSSIETNSEIVDVSYEDIDKKNNNLVTKSKTETVVATSEKNKGIQPYSFPMDNHMTELPMFLNYEYSKKKIDIINIEENPSLKQLENIKDIVANDNVERKIFKNEKNNLSRKLFMYNVGRLPRQFEQDVLNALVLLFIRKNSPFSYIKESNTYDIYTDKVLFTFYEVCMILGVEPSGFYIKKIKNAIRTLKATQYFSFDDGVFFDKKENCYVVTKEDGISWVADYKFLSAKSTKDMKKKDMNWVQFSSFMVHNLEFGYFNYLKTNAEMYFQLSSGFVRQVYSYIDKNMYDMNGNKLKYIKRFFDTIQFKLALDYKYPSQLKRRLNKALDELIEYRLISGYFYGDEVVFDKKEGCIYICSVSKEEVIKDLRKKQNKRMQQLSLIGEVAIDDEDRNNYLRLPSNLKQELLNKGMDENVASELISKYNKWDIIKYVLWIDKQVLDGKKLPNKAGLLRIAIQGSYDISSGYSEIINFVNQEKDKQNKKKEEKIKSLDELYDEYIEQEVNKLKEEEEDTYNLLYDTILSGIEANMERLISNMKIAKQDTKELEEFIKLKDKSNYFKGSFYKEIRLYKNLKSFEDFKNQQMSKDE